MSVKPAPTSDIGQLVSLLLEDQAQKWSEDNRSTVESYCQRHPSLLAHPDALLDLVYNEVVLREGRGEKPQLADYQQRFPTLRDRLRDQFDVHRALQSTSNLPSAIPLDTPAMPAASPSPKVTSLSIVGYEIHEEIGRGGMGIVHKAKQTTLDRMVALKLILHPEYATPEERTRFRNEAQAVARLVHPNIVQIYETGEANGVPFFSMELVEGGSLADKLHGSPCSAKQSAQIIETLAQAVHAAHQTGLVHRDLKPGNVLVAKGWTLKITDFGLAKKLKDQGQTVTGTVIGTPAYMPPEQASGKIHLIGPKADVYALGAMLYELLTGRPPFNGVTALDTLMQVIGEEPVPPRQFNSKVPRDLETICLKCLQKSADKRYQSAEALAEDLQRFRSGQAVVARPVGRLERMHKWIQRNPVVAGLLVALLLAMFVGTVVASWYAIRAGKGETQALQLKTRAEGSEADALAKATAERTQRKRAEEAEERANERADRERRERDRAERYKYNFQIRRAEEQWNAGNTQGAVEILDSTRWDFRRWEYHYLRARFDEKQEVLPESEGYTRCVVVSPDGKLVTGGGNKGIKVWDASGRLEQIPPVTVPISKLAFHPDGNRIVAITPQGNVQGWEITREQQGRLGSAKSIFTFQGHLSPVESLFWTAAGKRVIAVSEDGMAKIWNPESAKEIASIRGVFAPVVISPDGRYFAGRRSRKKPEGTSPRGVGIWETETGNMAHSLPWAGSLAAFSPDSRRFLAETPKDRGFRPTGMRVCDVRTGNSLLTLPKAGAPASYSPDGKRIVSLFSDSFLLQGKPRPSLSARVWDGTTGKELCTLLGAQYHGFDKYVFSPDGKRISVTVTFPAMQIPYTRNFSVPSGTIKTWNASDGQLLMNYDEQQANSSFPRAIVISPDNARFFSALSGTIKTQAIPTSAENPIFEGAHPMGVYSVAINSNGTTIASIDQIGQLRVWNADTGEELWRNEDQTAVRTKTGGLAFSPDGSRLIALQGHVSVFDAKNGKKLLSIPKAEEPVAISPDGRKLVAGWYERGHQLNTPESRLKMWDTATGKEILDFKPRLGKEWWGSVVFSHDSRLIAFGGLKSGIQVWDARTNRVIFLKRHQFPTEMRFSEDGRRLIGYLPRDKSVKVWDINTGYEYLSLTWNFNKGSCFTLSPNGRWVALGGDDNTITIHDAELGQKLVTLAGHYMPVNCLQFSPNGKWLVSGGSDSKVKLWKAPHKRYSRSLRGSDDPFTSAGFTKDGCYLIGVEKNGQQFVWDAKTGQLEQDPKLEDTRTQPISPDGTWRAEINGSYLKLVPIEPETR